MTEEEIIQLQVVEYLKQCTDLPFLHIANERQTSAQHGAKLKRLGVRAGVADILIPRATKAYHGTWIELKTPTGKLSSAQGKFLAEMHHEGYSANVAYSAAEAIFIIQSIYNLPVIPQKFS